MKNNFAKENENGYAIISVMLVMVIMMLLSTGILFVLTNQHTINEVVKDSNNSFYSAEGFSSLAAEEIKLSAISQYSDMLGAKEDGNDLLYETLFDNFYSDIKSATEGNLNIPTGATYNGKEIETTIEFDNVVMDNDGEVGVFKYTVETLIGESEQITYVGEITVSRVSIVEVGGIEIDVTKGASIVAGGKINIKKEIVVDGDVVIGEDTQNASSNNVEVTQIDLDDFGWVMDLDAIQAERDALDITNLVYSKYTKTLPQNIIGESLYATADRTTRKFIIEDETVITDSVVYIEGKLDLKEEVTITNSIIYVLGDLVIDHDDLIIKDCAIFSNDTITIIDYDRIEDTLIFTTDQLRIYSRKAEGEEFSGIFYAEKKIHIDGFTEDEAIEAHLITPGTFYINPRNANKGLEFNYSEETYDTIADSDFVGSGLLSVGIGARGSVGGGDSDDEYYLPDGIIFTDESFLPEY